MQPIQTSIGRIIKAARRLRDVAGELGQLDLKAEIIDEISDLQELRDELAEGHSSADDASTHAQETAPVASKPGTLADNTMAVFQPSGETGTYGIASEPEPVEAEPEEPEPDAAETDSEDASSTAEAAAAATETPRKQEARRRRAELAEQRIAELESLHAVAANRVNSVLSPEQNKIRVKATKAARAEGKTGHEAHQFVYAAMKLTNEQRNNLAAARKELNSIRIAIGTEVAFLLDEDQKKRIAAEIPLK